MKTIYAIILVWLLTGRMICAAENNGIPFTLDDRDRIIRTEQKVDALEKRMDQIVRFLWVITGIFTTMMVSVFGFAFWDRKLSLAPLKKEQKRIISVLTENAKEDPVLMKYLKQAGFL